MGEHRVRVRGSSRRVDDPEKSHSPEVRDLLHRLSQTDYAPAPRREFRDELRAQLVAITPRVVAEGRDEQPEAAAASGATSHAAQGVLGRLAARRSGRRISWGRPLGVAAAVLTVCAVLLGGAVWMSRDSVPGDALYGLKRASENVQLSLADTPSDKAKLYLKLAWTRTTEAQTLLKHPDATGPGVQAAGVSKHTASLVSSTLASGDSDVRNAAQLLGQRAISTRSGSGLATLSDWAPAELTALRGVVAGLPQGSSAHRNATSSLQLVEQAQARAQELQSLGRCNCLAKAPTDDLGPIPCTNCSTTTSHAPPSSGTTTTHHRPGHPGSTPTTGSTGGNGVGTSGNGGNGTGGKAPPSSNPGSSPPSSSDGGGGGGTLPITPPTQLPISTGTCGVNVSVGPVSAGAGTCGVGVGI